MKSNGWKSTSRNFHFMDMCFVDQSNLRNFISVFFSRTLTATFAVHSEYIHSFTKQFSRVSWFSAFFIAKNDANSIRRIQTYEWTEYMSMQYAISSMLSLFLFIVCEHRIRITYDENAYAHCSQLYVRSLFYSIFK